SQLPVLETGRGVPFLAASTSTPTNERVELCIARHGDRIILIRRLRHDQLWFYAVQPACISAKHLFLNISRDFPFVHMIDGLPSIGSVEMWHVRRPQANVFEQIPQAKRDFLVALKSDVAALVENFAWIADLLSEMAVQLKIGLGFLQHQWQPARVGLQNRHL